jgi:hypothetical protein
MINEVARGKEGCSHVSGVRPASGALPVAGGVEHWVGGYPPSPPLEERVGERRHLLDLAARADMPTRCRSNGFGTLADNDGLLSLPLSSKGAEGNGAVTIEYADALDFITPPLLYTIAAPGDGRTPPGHSPAVADSLSGT